MDNKHKDAIHNSLMDIKVNVYIAIEALEVDDTKSVSKSMGFIIERLHVIHNTMGYVAMDALMDKIEALPFDEGYALAAEAIKNNPHIIFYDRMAQWTKDHIKLIHTKLKEKGE
jgi:c-di-GMP-binding flagellar brake protein YcgR